MTSTIWSTTCSRTMDRSWTHGRLGTARGAWRGGHSGDARRARRGPRHGVGGAGADHAVRRPRGRGSACRFQGTERGGGASARRDAHRWSPSAPVGLHRSPGGRRALRRRRTGGTSPGTVARVGRSCGGRWAPALRALVVAAAGRPGSPPVGSAARRGRRDKVAVAAEQGGRSPDAGLDPSGVQGSSARVAPEPPGAHARQPRLGRARATSEGGASPRTRSCPPWHRAAGSTTP